MNLLLLFFAVHQSSAVIHHLNLSEYSKMPALYAMDDYDVCLSEPGGTYCLIDAELYSKEHSDLMLMIQEYSDDKVKHYNHTNTHRALCVTNTCKQFIENRSLENEADLRSVLKECVDNAMWRDYKLNARLTDIHYCKKHGEKRPFSAGDYVVGGLYLILILLNAVGTSYDVLNGDTGNPYLLAFSLRKNWRKLTAPSGNGPEPRLNRLQAFNGLRTLTMIGVYMSHTALVNAHSYLKNPYYIETSYDEPGKYIIFNGTLVVYTFFMMSEFMLAFNFELYSEKRRVSLSDWPKNMLMRWLRLGSCFTTVTIVTYVGIVITAVTGVHGLRKPLNIGGPLTPTYALIMFTVMTLNRHLGDGPLWDQVVTSEADACRQYWWAHLFYFNNYIYDNTHCFPQSWYLAADTQLYALGLLLCIVCRKPRAQMLALGGLLVIALVIPAAHVYWQDLRAVAHQSPEAYRTLYKFDATYRLTYVPAHTNIATYVLGIAGGLLTYHWMNEKSMSQRLQKYAWLVWLSFPLAVATILSGGLFYMNHFEPSTLVKVLYAALHKPFFQLNVLVILIGCIFKVETVSRGILEWSGFAWTARVSYAGFLLHTIFQRSLVGSQRLPSYMSDYNIVTDLSATIFLSSSVGALLFLMVESPLAAVTKTILTPPRRKEASTTDNAEEHITKV